MLCSFEMSTVPSGDGTPDGICLCFNQNTPHSLRHGVKQQLSVLSTDKKQYRYL